MDIPANPEWLGSFTGANHSWLDCEVLTLENVDAAVGQSLWNHQDAIWFDYVRMHPAKALYYFCHCYSKAYGEYLGANINHELRFSRGLKGDPLQAREIRQFQTIKAEADARGIPYDFWVRRLFNFFASNGWTRPPRPAHLASSTEAKEYAHHQWILLMEGVIRHATDPWYELDNWIGHPQQKRYEQWLIDNINVRQVKEYALAYCLYDKQSLRIERAVQEFKATDIAAAQKYFEANQTYVSTDYTARVACNPSTGE